MMMMGFEMLWYIKVFVDPHVHDISALSDLPRMPLMEVGRFHHVVVSIASPRSCCLNLGLGLSH